MTYQTGTSAVSGSYRSLLTSLVALLTSKHVSVAAVNAGGTGYTVGDTLTITHAGAYLPCRLEVLTVGGSGEVLTVGIRSGGAFSNRVASVAIVAGGTGYTTGQVVRLTTGTFTEWAKLTVTAAAGVVTSAAVFETGGAYSSAPSSSGATNSDIGLGSGTGLTVTPTMTGLVGTSGIAATGGTGSSATFDLTLTDTGWSAVWNRNDYSVNSITDEKEVILQGTVAGGVAPLVGVRSYTQTSGITTRYGWLLAGMDSFNSALTFATMPNIGPNADPTSNLGVCFLTFDNAQSYWFVANERRFVAVVKAVGASITSYVSCYAGLLSPFGTQSESPYPMYVAGTTYAANRAPDDGSFFVTGLTECFSDVVRAAGYYRRASDGAWTGVQNAHTSPSNQADIANVMFPIGQNQTPVATVADGLADYGRLHTQMLTGGIGVSQLTGGAAAQVIMPMLGTDKILLWPATILTGSGTANDSETLIRGELDGVYWHGATKPDGSSVASEDTLTQGSARYLIVQNVHRTERYSFFALQLS